MFALSVSLSRPLARLGAAFLAVLGLAGCAQAGPFALGGRSAYSAFSNRAVAQLAQAACDGDAARIAALVRDGADVNGRGEQGITPLIWAMTCHNAAGMQALLQAGANPNLPMAAREVNKLGNKYWVLAKPDCTNKPFQGSLLCQPPVYLAAGGDDPKLLAILLDHGGNPNASDQNYRTPLFNAVARRRLENVKLLLAHGADVNYSDQNPLQAARYDFDMVLYLLQHAKFSRANLQDYADSCLSRPERGTSGFAPDPTPEQMQIHPNYEKRPQVVAYFKAQGIVPHKAELGIAPPPSGMDQWKKENEEFRRKASAFMEEQQRQGKLCRSVSEDDFGNLYCDNVQH